MSPYLSLPYARVPRVVGIPTPPSTPTIVVEPTDEDILTGTSATLNVTAIGTEPLTYQWYEGESGDTSTPVSGATLASFTTPNLTADHQYWVRVSNVAGSDDSRTVEVTVFPLPEDVLGPPEWLGSFRISADGISNTNHSFGGMGGRNDGGTIKLYFTASLATPAGPPNPADMFSESIIQVVDPGSYSTTYATAPIATTTFYTNEYRDKRFTWRNTASPDPDFFEPGFAANAGVYYDETTDLLYICYADVYDTGALQTHGLLGVELSAVQTVPPHGSTIGHGPWSIRITDGDGNVRRGPRSCLYLARHSVTNDIMVGSTLTSGDASCTWGPSFHTGASLPTTSTPVGKNEVFDVPDCGMHYYHMGFGTGQGGGFQLTNLGLLQPGKSLRSFRRRLSPGPFEPFNDPIGCNTPDDTLNVDPAVYSDAIGFTGSWRSNEFVAGGQYIQIGTKAVYLYCAALIDGHAWYQNECKPLCTHGLPPAAGLEATGPTTTSLFPAFIGFAPADIEAGLAGSIEEWEIEAAYEVNVEAAYPGIRTSDNSRGTPRAFAMGYFDPPSRKLFIVAHRADDSRPGNGVGTLIHVFQWPEDP